MALISTADFRTGLTIQVDGEPYQILEFQHVKPGKGSAFVRTKLKNIRTGRVLEKTFSAGERMDPAHVEHRKVQYLYRSGDQYTFMDLETYDQFDAQPDLITGEKYLQEGMECEATLFEGNIIGIEVPAHVELKVTMTDPGIRGDTATGGTKPATLETGAVVQVPLFVQVGDMVRVDTRTDTYIERMKK